MKVAQLKLEFCFFFSVQNHILIMQSQFSSVTQSCPILCHPVDCSTPAFPFHHQLPELAQTHVHEVGVPSCHLILCCPLNTNNLELKSIDLPFCYFSNSALGLELLLENIFICVFLLTFQSKKKLYTLYVLPSVLNVDSEFTDTN